MYQKDSCADASRTAAHTYKSSPVRFFVSLFLLFALMLSMVPLRASADSGTFQFSHYSQENITLSFGNGAITVSNLPSSAAFQKIWLCVIDGSKRTRLEARCERDAYGCVAMSLQSLSAGDYYIELYFSIGELDYMSYAFGTGIRFRWQNGTGTFYDSPVLAHNKAVFSAGRTDDTAISHYLSPSSLIQSTNSAITKLAAEITDNISGDYEKALAIHDWVCNNIWYNLDSAEGGKRQPADAVTTLNNRRAVCSGFSNLMAALLRAVGIPAKTVNGCAVTIATAGWTKQQLSGEEVNHAWNEAYIDGRWVIIDATWNCSNDYAGGKKIKSGGIYSYRYFDANMEAFSIDHRILGSDDAIIGAPVPPSRWAAEPISSAISSGLVPRALRARYTQAITRAEFCALATQFYETVTDSAISGRKSFDDTGDVNVEKMAAIGVVQGIGYGLFDPDGRLTREQAAVVLSRLAAALGNPLTVRPPMFADNSSISPWAYDSVGQMQTSGIMEGVGFNLFSPKSNYTREQSIVTILRLYNLVK